MNHGPQWRLTLTHKRVSLRRHNCERISAALESAHSAKLGPWLEWVDPLSEQSIRARQNEKQSSALSQGYHTFYYDSIEVQVPLSWYWREIEDWELESIVTIYKINRSIG